MTASCCMKINQICFGFVLQDFVVSLNTKKGSMPEKFVSSKTFITLFYNLLHYHPMSFQSEKSFLFITSYLARHHIIKDDEDGEQVSEDENASDDEDQLNKLVDSKLNGDDKDTDAEDEDDADDDGARLRKLMRSAKLSTREKSNNNDDDDDDDDNQKSKDSEEGVESVEENSDNEILAKLLKSKLRGKEKLNDNKDDDDDDDDDNSLQTEDKLASSKEDASDENSDGDDDNIDANNSNETDDNKKRSKFPLRFKPPKLKDTHKKVKKSRFRHPKKKPKQLKSKHKRWLETAS